VVSKTECRAFSSEYKWCVRRHAQQLDDFSADLASPRFCLHDTDKTIKLWKVFEKSLKVVAENNLSNDAFRNSPYAHNQGNLHPSLLPAVQPLVGSGHNLRLPSLTHHDTIVAAVPRKIYANAHAYHINSISVNSDGETYISADDLRINLWNLNISDQSFNIVDIKPVNMEELTEVITAAEFHPINCNNFVYSSSKGTIKLADMRDSALCDHHAKRECLNESGGNKSAELNMSPLPFPLVRFRGRGRSIQQVVFQRDHLVYLGRQVQS
jgi:serine/threonine-protein phosphatase 2A regulatory subunit B